MLGPEFASCWLKIGRAEKHAEFLYSDIKLWVDSHPHVITRKCNPNGSRHWEVLTVKIPPRLDHWALAVGDCVHNLRSALDHFVYAAAINKSKSDPPPSFDKLQFPIVDKPENFPSKIYRIAPLGTNLQVAIENLQPYK